LFEYNQKAKRCYFDILQDFNSAKPPLEYLLDLISKLQPRPFSISSAFKVHPNEIHVSMVVVQYKSIIHRLKKGICSTWLASLDCRKDDVHIPIWVKEGTMTLPQDPSKPIIMVGPGTGCAIFRAFLQERNFHRQK